METWQDSLTSSLALLGKGFTGDNYSQSTHVAMGATPDAHGNLVRGAKPVVHQLRRGIHDHRRRLAIRERVARALVDDHGTRRQRGHDGVRIVREVLGVVHELAKRRVAPPPRAGLAVLQRLVLPAHGVVAIRARALHARRHGHGDGDAGIEEASRQSPLAEAGAARHAHLVRVDLGKCHVQCIQRAVEAPSPRGEDT